MKEVNDKLTRELGAVFSKIERMTMISALPCHKLLPFDTENWSAIANAFAPIEPILMQQAWHETNENDFMPAQIRFGWEEATLWVFAQLQDNDIFNAATKPNQATHLLGDVLEIFLRLAWQNQYFELHVTPENQTMQLRWPRVHHNFKDEEDKPVESESCSNVLRHTVTRVETAENRWQVLAAVDARAVSERLLQPNDRWFFSVSRYDYTRGRAHPILSSTSPHREINFHRHAEWGQLLFTDESACG